MNKSTVIKFFINSNRNFKWLLLITFLLILYSHPFLKYPYDMWLHLIRIDNVYGINEIFYKRKIWYLFWAETFHLLSIEDFFLRARIIHIVQTIICLFSVFFFSHVLIRNIFKDINKSTLNYLSYWCALIWLTIYATASVYYHQVWIMWYSINYQIALAFFWYITGLTLILICEKKKFLLKIFYCVQIFLFSYIILLIHPMELGYYFMYLAIFVIVYFNKIMCFIRLNYYTVLPAISIFTIFLFYLFSYGYGDKTPPFIRIINNSGLESLYEIIMVNNQDLVNKFNRASASINELMLITFFIGTLMTIDVFRKVILNKECKVNLPLFIITICSSLFVIIPVFQFSASLSSLIFTFGAMHRIYYSSSLYVIIPIGIYYFWTTYSNKLSLSKINISIISIIIITFFYSKFFSESHNYYKNWTSLANSWEEKKVGFQLSQDNIETIGVLLNNYEKQISKNGKEIIYFAREDVTFVLKYIYKRDVYQRIINENDKSTLYTFEQFYAYSKDPKVVKTKIPIIFRIPRSFPRYMRYM